MMHNDAKYAMDDVKCTGEEATLQNCTYRVNHNCYVGEAAGVICK